MNVSDYDKGKMKAIKELSEIFAKIEVKERNLLIGRIAADIGVSFTSVWNYAVNKGTNYRMALLILETLKKIK